MYVSDCLCLSSFGGLFVTYRKVTLWTTSTREGIADFMRKVLTARPNSLLRFELDRHGD